MWKIMNIILLIFLMGFCVSCEEEQKPAPENLIQEGEMIMILKDISKIEARFQRRLSLHGKNNADLVFENYKVVFDDYNVTIDQFKTSYTYYQDSPELMTQLFDSVIVELTKEQSQMELTPKEEKMPVK